MPGAFAAVAPRDRRRAGRGAGRAAVLPVESGRSLGSAIASAGADTTAGLGSDEGTKGTGVGEAGAPGTDSVSSGTSGSI